MGAIIIVHGRHGGDLGPCGHESCAEKCSELGYLLKTERIGLVDGLDMVVKVTEDLSQVSKYFIFDQLNG